MIAAPLALASETINSYQATTDYKTLITKHDVVEQLLKDALIAFKSPARKSDAGFTAKMPTNIEIVTNKLLQAYKLEPYRTDLLISAANAQIYNKNIDRAVGLFKQALIAAPDSIDINSYLAVWEHARGNKEQSKLYLQTLDKLNSGRSNDIKKIFKTIDSVASKPLKTEATYNLNDHGAIVTLGYALNLDGSMNDILIKRLETTLRVAKK